MKQIIFLLFITLFWGCSGSSEGGPGAEGDCSCSGDQLICSSIDCGDDKTCYNNTCYDDTDQTLGKRKLFAITKTTPTIVSGDQLLLKVQALRTGFEDTPKEIVGPIRNSPVTFKVLKAVNSTASLTDSVSGTTGEEITINTDSNAGIASATFNATIVDPAQKSNIRVLAILNECSAAEASGCMKTFQIEIDKRSKLLSIIGSATPSVYSGGQINLIVQVTSNNSIPYEGQEVTFTVKNGKSTLSSLEDSTKKTATTVHSEKGTGLTSVTFHAEVLGEDGTGSVIVEVSSPPAGVTSYTLTIRPSPGNFCDENDPDSCKSLGVNYTCQNRLCVYSAYCNSPDDCPGNFECTDHRCIALGYICNPILEPDCACQDQNNCPDGYICESGKCEELIIDCYDDTECVSYGLVCDTELGLCVPHGTECKVAANCKSAQPEMCPNETDCFCNNGNCIAFCPNSSDVEIGETLGVDNQSCTKDSNCADNELCVITSQGNKCSVIWNGNYEFHLIHALPEGLQTFFNVIQKYFTGIVSDFLMAELDFGVIGSTLSWVIEPLQEALAEYIKGYIPDWVEELIIGLDDSIQILQNMKVDAKLAFLHGTPHSALNGMERWDKFFVYWNGDWEEVKPKDSGQNFQVNSSQFTGSVYCGLDEYDDPHYYLEVDRHSAQFYFGYFILSFLENFLIPAVTANVDGGPAHSIKEAVDLAINCDEITAHISDFVRDWVEQYDNFFLSLAADLIVGIVGSGFCEMGKTALVNKITSEINDLHFGDENSQKFTFSGGANIIVDDVFYSDEMLEGEYEGTLDLDKSRSFDAEWEANRSY